MLTAGVAVTSLGSGTSNVSGGAMQVITYDLVAAYTAVKQCTEGIKSITSRHS